MALAALMLTNALGRGALAGTPSPGPVVVKAFLWVYNPAIEEYAPVRADVTVENPTSAALTFDKPQVQFVDAHGNVLQTDALPLQELAAGASLKIPGPLFFGNSSNLWGVSVRVVLPYTCAGVAYRSVVTLTSENFAVPDGYRP